MLRLLKGSEVQAAAGQGGFWKIASQNCLLRALDAASQIGGRREKPDCVKFWRNSWRTKRADAPAAREIKKVVHATRAV